MRVYRNGNDTIPPKRSIAGFTLLEIMISLGILSIIFTIIYGTFNNVYHSSEQMEEDAERYRLTRLGIYYLSNDLTMVYITPKIAGSTSATNTAELTFRGEDSERLEGNTTFPNDALEFSTVSHAIIGNNTPESDRAVIRYSLQDQFLIQEARLSNGRTVVNELGGPIEGLSFRYFDKKADSWLETWDADVKNNRPPTAVEIEFIMQQEGQEARRFKTWVDIPMGRS